MIFTGNWYKPRNQCLETMVCFTEQWSMVNHVITDTWSTCYSFLKCKVTTVPIESNLSMRTSIFLRVRVRVN